MPKRKRSQAAEEDERLARLGAAAERIADLFEKYEITDEQITAALEEAKAATLARRYPELAAETVAP